MGAFFRPFTRTWLVPLDLLFGPGKPLQNILVIYKIFVGVILSFPSARKQRLFVNKFRSSEPAEGRMETRTSLPASSKLRK